MRPVPAWPCLPGEGPAFLPQGLEPLGEGLRLSGQLSRRLLFPGNDLPGEGWGDVDILCQMVVELLPHGAQHGHGLGRPGGGLSPGIGAGALPPVLEPQDALHDALRGPALLGLNALPAQGVQHQVEVHLQGHRGRRGGSRGAFPLLQQLQGHKGPRPLRLFRPGQQFLREGLGQSAEGGEDHPLPGEHAHIRFCHRDGFHQKHPLWISSIRLTATLAWLLLSWGPTYFCR